VVERILTGTRADRLGDLAADQAGEGLGLNPDRFGHPDQPG